MDITPNGLGALVDVTEPAEEQMLNRIADAYGESPEKFIELLGQLSDARAEVKSNRDLDQPDWKNDSKAEAAEGDVQAARAGLVKLLDSEDRVTVQLLAEGCRKQAEELWAAAEQTIAARVGRERGDLAWLPRQRTAGQDAA